MTNPAGEEPTQILRVMKRPEQEMNMIRRQLLYNSGSHSSNQPQLGQDEMGWTIEEAAPALFIASLLHSPNLYIPLSVAAFKL